MRQAAARAAAVEALHPELRPRGARAAAGGEAGKVQQIDLAPGAGSLLGEKKWRHPAKNQGKMMGK